MPNPILRRRIGGSLFSPASLSGLSLWVRADTGLFQDSSLTTPAVADTDKVGGWVDLSGSGNHLLQATAGNRPQLKVAVQNGRNVVRFAAATPTFLDSTLASAASPSTLILAGAQTATGWYADTTSITNGRAMLILSSTVAEIFAVAAVANTVASTSGWHVNGGVFNGALSLALFDLASTTGSTTASGTGIRFGQKGGAAGNGFSGDVGEIIFYNRALSLADMLRLQAYLKSRWGTP